MKIFLYVFTRTIIASKTYRVITNSSGSGNQPSMTLLCDIMMYKHKDISSIPPIKWGLKHEATVILAYLKVWGNTQSSSSG